MEVLEKVRDLWEHARWADARLLDALLESGSAEALREFAHVLGAQEVWLARLEGRAPRTAVWPAVPPADLPALVEEVHAGFGAYLAGLDEAGLERVVAYTNSAGRAFENSVVDVLLHVALHGQYHRGKVNLMLRQSAGAPAPADYIGFVRGAPAATRSESARSSSDGGSA